MMGLYRPMFGYYNPDHESLSNQLTGFTQNAVFKSVGIGTAPNVPFANIHLILPTKGNTFSQEEGFNINIGGRFVTYSLSFKASYWDTQLKDGTNDLKKTLYAFTAGGMIYDLIINAEMVIYEESHSLGSNSGGVYTLDTKYRFWRENYLVLNWASSNTSRSKSPGQASELGFGYKGYWLPGLKFELLYITRQDKESPGKEVSEQLLQGQIHYFF